MVVVLGRSRIGCAPTVRPDPSRAVAERLWGDGCLGAVRGRDAVAHAVARAAD